MRPRPLLSCVLMSILSTATARPWWLGPFDRDGCLTQVTSMLESGNISMTSNSSLFFHDSSGLLLSNDMTSPILTPPGCEQLCSAYVRPPKNSVPRLLAWLLPIMLLVTNVHYAPIGWRTYLAVFLVIGDPIDSMLSLLSILQDWNRPNPEQAKREKSTAIILLSLGECLSLPNTGIPHKIYDELLASSNLSELQLDALTHRTAAELVECRTREMFRACSALLLYFFQVLAAFVPAIGDSASPSGGMIGPAMLLSWLLPMVLLSNAVGGFNSWRIRQRTLSGFLKRVGQHTWDKRLQDLKRSTLAYSGGIPLYQPEKFHWARARIPILLSLLSTSPVLVAFATAFRVLYTPPTYLTCRHFLVLSILFLWLLSALVTWALIKFPSLSAKLRWYAILAKDALIFCIILALLIGTSCGLFTSCWCLSGRWTYGVAQARVYLDPAAQFARNSRVSYPITVGMCFAAQFGIWLVMMSFGWKWFGWKGFGIWRWSEEEKENVLKETEFDNEDPLERASIENPGLSAEGSGQVQVGRRDLASGTGVDGDGVGQEASLDTGEHEQPGGGVEGSGQVRAGGRDSASGTGALRDGAGQGASLDTDEHEQPGLGAEGAGQVRAGRRDSTSSTGPEGNDIGQGVSQHTDELSRGSADSRAILTLEQC